MLKFVCLVILFGAIAAHPRPHHKEHGYRSKNATIPLSGTTGIDISSLVLEDTFKCLKSNGYDFVIVRAYTSECELICSFLLAVDLRHRNVLFVC